jgi:hypothetical protein
MRRLSLSSILLVILFSAQFAPAQTNRRRATGITPTETSEPVPVSVILKDGQTLKGKFVSANTKKLTIIVGSSTQDMNMSEIASLIFSETRPSPVAAVDTGSTSTARDAIKALRKLDSATSAGVTRTEYGTRLIDAKATVDDLLPRIAEGDLKSEIVAAMREYVAASDAWQALYEINLDEISRGHGTAGVVHSVPKWIVEKYSIKPDDPGVGMGALYITSSILSAVWHVAKDHLDKAAQLAQ